MPAPIDLNSKIALAKGWLWDEETLYFLTKPPVPFRVRAMAEVHEYESTHWINPQSEPAIRPDYVGTAEGVAGLMRELNERQYRKEKALLHPQDVRLHWSWRYVAPEKVYHCALKNQGGGRYIVFESPGDCPGHCVGEAYMSVHGGDDAS